ncbi:hypothetical protein ACHAW6_000946 [Cyclotella cf. meneghiniana]
MKVSLTLIAVLTFFLADGVVSQLQAETPNLRAVTCSGSDEVTGRRELTGCSKAKTFTRSTGACSGYSKSYGLAGYNSAEDCANYCMIDEKGLANLKGFHFDCVGGLCECLQGRGSIKTVKSPGSGWCYKLTSEISGTSGLKKGQKMSKYCSMEGSEIEVE